MNAPSDLLRRYVNSHDEDAFREVVVLYFNFVHGIALRRLAGDSTRALDVVQSVFTDLAFKAHKLRDDTQLGGWLHHHTCFVASKCARSESRRLTREQLAAQMQSNDQIGDDPWSAIAPIVDEALQDLSEIDRSAILLRYFEGRDLRSIGALFRVNEDAAQKRVHRALERLKSLLQQKGVAISVVALGAILTANASPVVALPPINQICECANAQYFSSSKSSSFVSPKTAVTLTVATIAVLVFVFLRSNSSTAARPVAEALNQVASRAEIQISKTEPSAGAQPFAVANQTKASEITSATDSLVIHVTDSLTKLPIPQPTVRISNGRAPQPTTSFVEGDTLIVGDEKGTVIVPLSNTRKNRLMLQTYADGYADWVSIWDKSTGENVPAEFSIALEHGVPLGGRVLDEQGAPVTGAELRFGASPRDGAMTRKSQQAAIRPMTNVTDAAGVFLDTHMPESSLNNLMLFVFHPDFVRTHLIVDSDGIKQLRARTFTIKLAKGIDVTGRVTSQTGDAVADAILSYGRPSSVYRVETKTDSQGHYTLKSISPEGIKFEKLFAVVAPGFAVASQQFTPNGTSNELNFVLQPGHVIRGRVVNAAGQPLGNVRVIRSREDGIEWHMITQDDGRFSWDGSPNSPQSFYFGVPSYVEIRNRLLAPQDEDYEIVLQKPETIKGAVTDAVTRKPIPEFFVARVRAGANRSILVEPIENQFKNGSFEVPVGDSSYNDIRIRASGYFTTLTPIPADNKMSVALKQAPTIEGLVIDFEGKPVPAVEVAAVPKEPNSRVAIGKGRLVTEGVVDQTRTDGMGRFKLFLSAEARELVAAHPEAGFAESPLLTDSETTNTLRLLRWARVEGTLLTNGIPFAGQEVGLSSRTTLDYNDFKNAVTDAGGRFSFDLVPPVNLHLSHRHQLPRTQPGEVYFQFNRPIPAQTNFTAAPGAVTYIELDAAKVPQASTNRPSQP